MRGLTVVRTFGVNTVSANGAGLKFESSAKALTVALSSIERRSKSTKKDDFLVSGPLRFPPQYLCWYGALVGAKGFRELKMSSPKLKNAVPRNLSEPGLVKISILP